MLAKSVKESRIKENLKCTEVKLDAEDMKRIKELDRGFRYVKVYMLLCVVFTYNVLLTQPSREQYLFVKMLETTWSTAGTRLVMNSLKSRNQKQRKERLKNELVRSTRTKTVKLFYNNNYGNIIIMII